MGWDLQQSQYMLLSSAILLLFHRLTDHSYFKATGSIVCCVSLFRFSKFCTVYWLNGRFDTFYSLLYVDGCEFKWSTEHFSPCLLCFCVLCCVLHINTVFRNLFFPPHNLKHKLSFSHVHNYFILQSGSFTTTK